MIYILKLILTLELRQVYMRRNDVPLGSFEMRFVLSPRAEMLQQWGQAVRCEASGSRREQTSTFHSFTKHEKEVE